MVVFFTNNLTIDQTRTFILIYQQNQVLAYAWPSSLDSSRVTTTLHNRYSRYAQMPYNTGYWFATPPLCRCIRAHSTGIINADRPLDTFSNHSPRVPRIASRPVDLRKITHSIHTVYADSYRLVDLGITDASSSRNYNTSTLLRLFRLVACSFAYVKLGTKNALV